MFKSTLIVDLIEYFCQFSVHIGGSIFIEPELYDSRSHRIINKNTFYIGCNYGPIKSENYYKLIYSRISNMKDICFRDSYSYEQFSNQCNVRSAPDILFGYKKYPKYKKGKGIGISVIDLFSRSDLREKAKVYYDSIVQLLNECHKKDIKVILFGFCEDEGDANAIEYVKDIAKSNTVTACNYSGNIDEFLEVFNECEYIIATRFHAMIIGWCLNKKVLPITYSEKQINVIKDVNYNGSLWNLLEDDTEIKDIYELCQRCEILDDISSLVTESEKQFMALDEYIKNWI